MEIGLPIFRPLQWYDQRFLITGGMIVMHRMTFLQKVSMGAGVLSELLSLFCLVMLWFKYQELGSQHIVTASYLASTFFFFTCGFVLIMISRANLPRMDFSDLDDTSKKDNEDQH